jgi:plasmid stabilization system protein ParE
LGQIRQDKIPPLKHFFSAEALSGLQRLHDFIAQENSTATARDLLEGIGGLRRFPRMGKRVAIAPGQQAPDEIRDWFTGNYIVRYLILDKRIVILRIWHGKENRA